MNEEVSFISEIKTFEHEQFRQIRFVDVIFKDVKREDKTWFVAIDICRAFNLENVTKSLYALDDDEKMTLTIGNGQKMTVSNTYSHSEQPKNGVTNSLTTSKGITGAISGGWIENRLNFVSEPGMYRLIFQSRKPEAKKFKRWVFHEVLPSIRRYGYYVAPHQIIRSIEGRKNFDALKAKYPDGAIELKRIKFEYEDDGCGGEISHKIYKFVLHTSDN